MFSVDRSIVTVPSVYWRTSVCVECPDIKDPIVGFVLTNAGLMYNLKFEGSKYSKIDR